MTVDTLTNIIPPYGSQPLPVSEITSLLENVLFESPSLAAANAARWEASSSLLFGVEGSASAMLNTPEASIPEEVIRLYQGVLGRVPGASEIAFYVGLIESQASSAEIFGGAGAIPSSIWDNVAGYFINAPEFQAAGTGIVTALYQHVLARTPSPVELAYYADAMANGTSPAQLVQYFVNSPEFQAKAVPAASDLLADYGSAVANDPSSPPASLLDAYQTAENGLRLVLGATDGSEALSVGSAITGNVTLNVTGMGASTEGYRLVTVTLATPATQLGKLSL